eukprot:732989-Amphidinium_carterae.2
MFVFAAVLALKQTILVAKLKMESEHIVEHVARFAKASYSCGKPEDVLLAQLAESGKIALIENALSALSVSVTTLALLQFSCDTTPVALRKHVSFVESGQREKRSGKVGYEFQVQQCYVTCYNTQGEKQVCLAFGPAVPVLHRKTMLALSVALRWPVQA